MGTARPAPSPRELTLVAPLPIAPGEAAARAGPDPADRLSRWLVPSRAPLLLRRLALDWRIAEHRDGSELVLTVRQRVPGGVDVLLSEAGGRRWLRRRFAGVAARLHGDAGAEPLEHEVTTLQRGPGLLAALHQKAIVSLYAAGFAEPPYNAGAPEVAQFRQRLRWRVRQPGYSLTIAWDGGTAIGFTDSRSAVRGDPELEGILASVDPDVVASWTEPSMVLCGELTVAPGFRRRGLSRHLLTRHLAGRPEAHALLLVHPQADMLHAYYQRLGWRTIGSHTPGPDLPAFDVMARDLS